VLRRLGHDVSVRHGNRPLLELLLLRPIDLLYGLLRARKEVQHDQLPILRKFVPAQLVWRHGW